MAVDLSAAHEFIPDRLYLATVRSHPPQTSKHFYFTVDDALHYQAFNLDFGPLNMAMLHRYCTLVSSLLAHPDHKNKILVHYTTHNAHKRANAAYLIAAFAVVQLGMTADEAARPLANITPPLLPFRDASYGACTYKLSVLDCLRGLEQGLARQWLDLASFDVEAYEHYEQVVNGDLNVVLPGKFIAFASPHNERRSIEDGYPQLAPEDYVEIFRRHGVSDVVRLNKATYDRERFVKAGIKHHDLVFADGSVPPDNIVEQFLAICENAKGVVAVHCKAGLGRTGSLIGLYMMKHYLMTAQEVIGWLRICRPGSVLGPQQFYMHRMQPVMWARAPSSARRMTLRSAQVVEEVAADLELTGRLERRLADEPSQQDLSEAIAATFPAAAGCQGDYLTSLKAQHQAAQHNPPSSPTRAAQMPLALQVS